MDERLNLQEIINYCKENGFIFQSSEIYDGVQAIYDYGHYGSLLKQNVKKEWLKEMIQRHNNIVNIDSSIIMHPNIWKASGHVDNFDDLMIDNKDSKKRYRVDVFFEQLLSENKISQELFDKCNNLVNNNDLEGIYKLFVDNNIKCPISGTCNWTPVRHFNLMFNFKDIDDNTIYLRPETAQGIYVNFLNIQRSTHQKIPFGIAQIGKAFRNEIIARQFTFRMREFEQMEMQYFFNPNKCDIDGENNDKNEEVWSRYYTWWKGNRLNWYINILGIPKEKLRFKPHEKLAHYAKAAVDIEYEFPFGFKEIEGIHCRGDYDLSNHEQYSKKNLHILDPETNEKYIPNIIETSCGCDRIILMLLCEFIIKEKSEDKERYVFKINDNLAPLKCAILPLMKKPELTNVAEKIYNDLKLKYMCSYDDSGSIGKRYVRNDIVGTLKCITIDYQTLDDNTVTIRDRNTMEQIRVKIEDIEKYL